MIAPLISTNWNMKYGCVLDTIHASRQNAFIVRRMYRKTTAESIPSMWVVMWWTHLNLI